MVDCKRQIISERGESLDVSYNTLGDALERIQYLIDRYGKDAYIDTYEEPYSDREYLCVTVNRPETDDEMNHRIKREEVYEKIREEAELKEFKRLQAKYEGK